MPRSREISTHALPKNSWPARQKERLDEHGATKRFEADSLMLCQQLRSSVSHRDRTEIFHRLSDAVQSICELSEFDRNLAVFCDMKAPDSPDSEQSFSTLGSSADSFRPRHRAVAVGYSPEALSHSQNIPFPTESPIPGVKELRLKKRDKFIDSTFLLAGDAESRAFGGSEIPKVLLQSLFAMGQENFDMIDPMKAFQSSGYNHLGCPLGLLSHLTFIYQCEIRRDGTIKLNVIWFKVVRDEDDGGSSMTMEDSNCRLKFCKAPVDTFDLSVPKEAAKLLAWLHVINDWALKERLDAVRVSQQLDEVRHKSFQVANISLLREFGAEPSTSWLSEQILKPIPGTPTLAGQRSIPSALPSPATHMRKSLAERAMRKVEINSRRPPVPLSRTPPPVTTWKAQIPPPKPETPKVDATAAWVRSQSAESTPVSRRKVSADTFIPPPKAVGQGFSARLMLMVAIYDAFLESEAEERHESNNTVQRMPVAL